MSEGPTGYGGGGKPSVNVVVSQKTALVNGGRTFQLKLVTHRSLRDHPKWEDMVWDHCLRLAHAAGHVPVGPVLITDEDKPSEHDQLIEGVPMMLRGLLAGVAEPLMNVTAEVEIGSSLAADVEDPPATAEEQEDIDAEFQRMIEGGL